MAEAIATEYPVEVEIICQGCAHNGDYTKKKHRLGKTKLPDCECDAYLCPDCGVPSEPLLTMIELEEGAVMVGCIHEPGGHFDKEDPVCAPLSQGGLHVPYSKCQHCGKLIKQVFEIKYGKSITYYKEVKG